MASGKRKPLLLTILDGWGYSPITAGNAIATARKPAYDRLLSEYPNTLVSTSGPAVGLPEGQMGNSEVGHLNIGAGRVVYMDVTRIDMMIKSGEFFSDPVLKKAMAEAGPNRLHVMGLLSNGGVHSHNSHLYALLKLARQEQVREVFVHCFMDGRDTPPESGVGFAAELQKQMSEIGTGRIASVSGRYYAMDRDKRWERVERAFRAMVVGDQGKAGDPSQGIRRSYERGVTDEFIEPISVVDARNEPIGLIREGDSCIYFNYRADRAREMTMALTDEKLEQPTRSLVPKALYFVTMTQYDKTFSLPHVLPPDPPETILANVLSQQGLRNLRVAETEKYAHVTYFFNGGNEKPYSGEEREMVSSPKVATYDLKPEMSAAGVTEVVMRSLVKGDFDLIVMNFANADMVGHSGRLGPTVTAVETVDECLDTLYGAVTRNNANWLITADHGNAETMVDPVTGGPHTYHTTNPVPFVYVGENAPPVRTGGALQDVAPTILGILDIEVPHQMQGKDLRKIPGKN